MKKKQTAFTVILVLLIAGIFSSCKKEEIEENPPQILGKWQLVDANYSNDKGESIRTDYSNSHIFYDFQENNVLVVSGDTIDIDDYRGHGIGEYSYKAFPVPKYNLARVRIETLSYSYTYFNESYVGERMNLNFSQKRANLTLIKTGIDQ
jgi:hypothetical protein